MSPAHKEALARGREESKIVGRYLEALENDKVHRGRQYTPEEIQKRLTEIDSKLLMADPLSRLQLTQEQQDLKAEASKGDTSVDLAALEKEFLKVAKGYSVRRRIAYATWRTMGVSASVLDRAGIPKPRD